MDKDSTLYIFNLIIYKTIFDKIMQNQAILNTNYPKLKLFKRGKVRDMFDVGDYYLMVATDRLSAFDVILRQGIPDKGKILNTISKFWFDYIRDEIGNHVISTNVNDYPDECKPYISELDGRSMLVKKAELIPLECIVRGYISGSGWKEYQQLNSICGIQLPSGLVESEKLSEPIFTPSTKAEIGDHDENISAEFASKLVGEDVFDLIKKKALNIYNLASEYALQKGIIIADTKMEFGIYDGDVILIDELLTPDSSRFWPVSDYEKGRSQNSYDKQYVRDYLLSINFNKKPPSPILPDEVIINTSEKYADVLYKLTGMRI